MSTCKQKPRSKKDQSKATTTQKSVKYECHSDSECCKKVCKGFKKVNFDKSSYCLKHLTKIATDIKENIPARYINEMDKNLIQIMRISENSLFITGDCGSGKTSLAFGILHYHLLRGNKAKYISYPEYLHKLKHLKSEGDTTLHSEIMNISDHEGLLILDDVWADPPSDLDTETLYLIINSRYLHNRLTIIISNMDLEQIAYRDCRLASRIQSMCKELKLKEKCPSSICT